MGCNLGCTYSKTDNPSEKNNDKEDLNTHTNWNKSINNLEDFNLCVG